PADPLCGQVCMGLAVPAFIWDPGGFLWIYQELEWSGSGSYDVLVPPDPAASLWCRRGFSLELCSAFGLCPQVADGGGRACRVLCGKTSAGAAFDQRRECADGRRAFSLCGLAALGDRD